MADRAIAGCSDLMTAVSEEWELAITDPWNAKWQEVVGGPTAWERERVVVLRDRRRMITR